MGQTSKKSKTRKPVGAATDEKFAVMAGETSLDQGLETMAAAVAASQFSAANMATAASDATRSEDASVVADRISRLSQVVAEAGIADVGQGAELLAASEDVGVLSAMVGLMSSADMDHGLDLARMAGELWTVGDVVDILQMPVLADFLENRGLRLQEMAVEQILRSAGRSSLSRMMADTGEKIAALGENEVAEGVVRQVVADEMAGRAGELEAASIDMAVRSAVEMTASKVAADTARAMAAEGLVEIAEGSNQIGAAEARPGNS